MSCAHVCAHVCTHLKPQARRVHAVPNSACDKNKNGQDQAKGIAQRLAANDYDAVQRPLEGQVVAGSSCLCTDVGTDMRTDTRADVCSDMYVGMRASVSTNVARSGSHYRLLTSILASSAQLTSY